MAIENLVETTWLVQYPWRVEITYDQGREFLGQKFKSSLTEQEYGIKTKSASPRNPQENAKIERIHQVLRNIVHTYNLQETYVYVVLSIVHTVIHILLTVVRYSKLHV